jgi:hypothetical protein
MEAVLPFLATAYIQQSAQRHLTQDAAFNSNVVGNSHIRELNILPLLGHRKCSILYICSTSSFLINLAVLMLYSSNNVIYTHLILVFEWLEAKCRLTESYNFQRHKELHAYSRTQLTMLITAWSFYCPRLDQFSPNSLVIFL